MEVIGRYHPRTELVRTVDDDGKDRLPKERKVRNNRANALAEERESEGTCEEVRMHNERT